MASTWAKDLPIATVPRSTTPKSITLIYPYYEQPDFFRRQVAIWRAYSEDLRPFVSAIVVDDGSPHPIQTPIEPPFTIALFRIDVDVPWNWLAARNIGAHHAPVGWLLLTDMDHVVPETTLHALVWGVHDPEVIYVFSRQEHTGRVVTPHSASFLMTRAVFWRIGGYDEALSGRYGTDGEFRRRARQHAKISVLRNPLIRYEYIGDSSTSRYPRKLPVDASAVKALVAARGPDWRPQVLSFPYHEIEAARS